MSEDKLRRFVSNFLHETQGFSEDSSVEYLIAKAKTAKTSNDIINELNLCGIDTQNGTQSKQFAQSLFNQVPRYHESQKLKQQKSIQELHQKILEQEKQKSYKLVSFVDSDDDLDNDRHKKHKKKKSKKDKKDKKRKHDKHRSKSESDSDSDHSNKRHRKRKHKFIKKSDRDRRDDSDDDGPPHKKRKMSLVSLIPSSCTILYHTSRCKDNHNYCNDELCGFDTQISNIARKEEEELKRLRDQTEKRELEARMKKKDLERKQKLTEEQLERLEEERKRKALKYGDKAQFERARIISERKYKEKRVEQQVYLYESRLRDEEDYFGDEHLTAKEREKREISKKVLNIAHETLKNRKDDTDGYYIPSAYDRTEEGLLDKKARENVMKGRYREEDELNNGNYRHEQEKWEEARMRDALGDLDDKKNYNLIADKWAKKAETEKDQYDTILDDQIQFIVDTMKEGKDLEQELKKEIEDEDKLKLRTKEARKLSLEQFRKTLPVYKFRDNLLDNFEQYQIMIIVAATGSGKTTQIPQYIYEERDRFLDGGKLKIGITQPRRVAAMSVASRVSQEMDCRLGSTVGYSVRFEDKTNEDTKVKYMTDGMLLREFLVDPLLESYGVIMIDEV